MAYEEEIREAARRAERGLNRAMSSLRADLAVDEDDLTGVLKGNLDAELANSPGGLKWRCKILRHRKGIAAEESEFGADMLIQVDFHTPELNYSKGVLVQAKKTSRGVELTAKQLAELKDQCRKMLKHSPASYVFDYSYNGTRCGSALPISSSENKNLTEQCPWTPYRFFWELFRCPIGDAAIVSPIPADLRVKALVQIHASID